jgi:hypothetical protein
MIAALYILLSLVVFWVFYLAAMNLLRANVEGKLGKVAWVIGTPVVFVGMVIDLVFNITLFSLLFLELPRELFVTKRLKRHIKSQWHGNKKELWRKSLALWICSNLLNPFDHTGDHCD